MKDKNAVSVGQFVLLLLAGRVSNCLLLPADSLHALSVPDLLLVTVLNALVLLFLLFSFLKYLIYTLIFIDGTNIRHLSI